MYKYIIPLHLLFISISLQAKTIEIPQQIRNTYSSNMYNAFILQSQGRSNSAFIQFNSAREEAKKAGESPLKIIATEQLFYWYRKYGSALGLFYKNPVGRERIVDEYRPPHYHSGNVNTYEDYKSEWGKTPEHAVKVREFMLGVGEFISGIFIATVYPGSIATGIAITLWADGFNHMFSSLNHLWAEHEALIQLKNCEQTTAKAMNA